MMRPIAIAVVFCLLAFVRLAAAEDDRAAGIAAFEAKNYREAYTRLSTVLQSAPGDEEIGVKAYVASMMVVKEMLAAKQYQEALSMSEWAQGVNREWLPEDSRFAASFNKGQALMGLGRLDEAVTWLKDAKELTANPVVLQVLGLAYYKKEDWANAASTLTEYGAKPGAKKDVGYYQHLAHATYESGDIPGALALVKEALARFPEDPTLVKLESKFRREDRTEGNMQQQSGVYFDVKFEDLPDQQDLRAKIVKALDEAYQQVTKDFSHFPDKNVPVVIYPSGASFSSGSGAPNWAAANFDGKIRIPVGAAQASDDSLRRVVTHEFTHYIVDRVTKRNCPTWFHEGLAQIEEKNDKEWAATSLRRYMGHRNLRAQIYDLAALEGAFSSIRDPELVSLAYSESYLAVKFISERHGWYRITQILEELGNGSTFADAMNRCLGVDPAGFQKQWLTAQAEEFHIDW